MPGGRTSIVVARRLPRMRGVLLHLGMPVLSFDILLGGRAIRACIRG